MRSIRVLLLPLVVVGCQIIGGIEVREEYRGAGSPGGSTGSGAEGGAAGLGAGGSEPLGGTSGEGGAAGESSGTAGDGAGGEGGGAVCGNGVEEGGESCDDGDENGQLGKCDSSCAFVCESPCPLRVDPEAAEGGDGASWGSALVSLQGAVDQQWEAGGGEVWVRATPIQSEGTEPLLLMRTGVDVYGGFAGTEPTRAERAAPTSETATVLDAQGLAYPAVRGAGGALLDGFAITGADGQEGPAFTAEAVSDLILRDVFFIDNHAAGCGGAMLLDGASVRLEGGSFEGNVADQTGGAICTLRATVLEIEGTRFVGNTALVRGGAVDAQGSYSPEAKPDLRLIGATFVDNRATRDDPPSSGGGALYQMAGTLAVVGSDFAGNSAAIATGAAVYLSDVEGTIHDSTFAENEGFNAAVFADLSSLTIVGCTFAFNDQSCPGTCDVNGDSILVQNSAIVSLSKLSTPALGSNVTTTPGNCIVFISGGLGQQPSPFGDAPLPDRDGNGVDDYLLVQPGDNPCLDVGNDATSTSADIDWSGLTTSGNNCLDVSPVDAGRHYQPTNQNPMPCE